MRSISDLNILKIEKFLFEFFSAKTVQKVSLNFLETQRSICTHLAHQNSCYGRTKKLENFFSDPRKFIMKTPIPLVISSETRYSKNSRIMDFFESVTNPLKLFLNLFFFVSNDVFCSKNMFSKEKIAKI